MTQSTRRGCVASAALLLAALASMTMFAGQQPPATAAAHTPREVFERARLMEDTQNLTAAIALYRQVATQTTSDRALAATAELRMGALYERLDKPETAKVYSAVMREFADQPSIATAARTSLARLTAQSAPSTHRIDIPAGFRVLDVTPNGQFALGLDQSGALAVQSLLSGQVKVVLAASTSESRGAPVALARWLSDSVQSPSRPVVSAKPCALRQPRPMPRRRPSWRRTRRGH